MQRKLLQDLLDKQAAIIVSDTHPFSEQLTNFGSQMRELIETRIMPAMTMLEILEVRQQVAVLALQIEASETDSNHLTAKLKSLNKQQEDNIAVLSQLKVSIGQYQLQREIAVAEAEIKNLQKRNAEARTAENLLASEYERLRNIKISTDQAISELGGMAHPSLEEDQKSISLQLNAAEFRFKSQKLIIDNLLAEMIKQDGITKVNRKILASHAYPMQLNKIDEMLADALLKASKFENLQQALHEEIEQLNTRIFTSYQTHAQLVAQFTAAQQHLKELLATGVKFDDSQSIDELTSSLKKDNEQLAKFQRQYEDFVLVQPVNPVIEAKDLLPESLTPALCLPQRTLMSETEKVIDQTATEQVDYDRAVLHFSLQLAALPDNASAHVNQLYHAGAHLLASIDAHQPMDLGYRIKLVTAAHEFLNDYANPQKAAILANLAEQNTNGKPSLPKIIVGAVLMVLGAAAFATCITLATLSIIGVHVGIVGALGGVALMAIGAGFCRAGQSAHTHKALAGYQTAGRACTLFGGHVKEREEQKIDMTVGLLGL